jgi:hypothetical protein
MKLWLSKGIIAVSVAVLCVLLPMGCAKSGAPKGGVDEVGVPVKIVVLDGESNPISTAVIRHPKEEDRRRVNTFDGSWQGSVLYLPDGSELIFEKGMELTFEISAPGYMNEKATFLVRSRKNVFKVVLQKMDFGEEADEFDEPVIQFGRDKPID